MKISNRRRMDDSSTHNIWRSYSDMMSGLLLLFILIMAVCLMQAQKNYAEKLAEQAKQLRTQNALEESQNQVGLQQEQLDEQQSKLDAQAATLSTQEKTLAEQASALQELQDALENQRLVLVEKESELDKQNALLKTKEDELEASQIALDEANDLMHEQQVKIDQIIGVKAELIEALDQEFRSNQINVQIDTQTGAILLDSSVLFEFNESELTEIGSQILDTVLPVYCKVLLDSEYADYVAEIIIDGYTDTTGDYVTNLSLSQQRAYAVAERSMTPTVIWITMRPAVWRSSSVLRMRRCCLNCRSSYPMGRRSRQRHRAEMLRQAMRRSRSSRITAALPQEGPWRTAAPKR